MYKIKLIHNETHNVLLGRIPEVGDNISYKFHLVEVTKVSYKVVDNGIKHIQDIVVEVGEKKCLSLKTVHTAYTDVPEVVRNDHYIVEGC